MEKLHWKERRSHFDKSYGTFSREHSSLDWQFLTCFYLKVTTAQTNRISKESADTIVNELNGITKKSFFCFEDHFVPLAIKWCHRFFFISKIILNVKGYSSWDLSAFQSSIWAPILKGEIFKKVIVSLVPQRYKHVTGYWLVVWQWEHCVTVSIWCLRQ